MNGTTAPELAGSRRETFAYVPHPAAAVRPAHGLADPE